MFRYLSVILLIAISALANATVINSADVGGYTTFQDTNTGRVWLDMNNFFDAGSNNGTSGYDMIAAAQNAGFTFATKNDVQELLGSLPLSGGEWSSYATVMGYGIPRQLIWGMYDDGNGSPYGWAYANSTMQSWAYNDDATDPNLIQNEGYAGAVDMGIWAYKTGTVSVPEPTSLALLGIGLVGLGVSLKRKHKTRVE